MTQLLDHRGQPIRVTPRRTIRARYDSAQTTRDNERHWVQADGLSAAAALSSDVRRTIRNRARYERDNNTYCCGMLRTLANDVIGVGPALQMESGDDEADTQIEHEFWKWSQAVGLGQKLRVMRIARAVDGESFALLRTNLRLGHSVKLDITVYEADQVARPFTSLSDHIQTDGIILDDFGNPLAYTLLHSHPGDLMHDAALSHDVIMARDMIHYFRAERPGQVRGVSEIASALPLYAQLRRYTLAVIAAAETAADLAAVLHTQAAPDNPDDLEPLDLFDLERRSIMTLPRGWQAHQFKAEQPHTTYAMFKREIINEIARCLGMPYNIAAGDSSGYNYSSGRLDHQTYFKSGRVDRDFTEHVALEPIYVRWWEEARLVPGVIPEQFRDLREPPDHEWRWDGHEHVDPVKEANAQAIRLANHTTTLAKEAQREGLDWEDVLRQRAKELHRMVELGITQEAPAQRAEEDDEDE